MQFVSLSFIDNALVGKYSSEEDVFVAVDTSLGNTSIYLPSLKDFLRRNFIIKHIGGNTLTICSINGESIDASNVLSRTIPYLETRTYFSNGIDFWYTY
jgi:hypothetical protein